MYADVTINVAMLQEVYANEGSDKVAVVYYSKMWTMVGTFLAAGDQVRKYSHLKYISTRQLPFIVESKYLEVCTQPVSTSPARE